MKTVMEKQESPPPRRKNEEEDPRLTEEVTPDFRINGDKEDVPSARYPDFQENVLEHEIPITLETDGHFTEVSKFAGRELVHLEPPKSPKQITSDVPPCQPSTDKEGNVHNNNDQVGVKKSDYQEKETSTFAIKPTPSANLPAHKSAPACPMKSEKKSLGRSPPVSQEDARFKDLLKAVDDNVVNPTWRYQDREGPSLALVEPPQLSPLPRLRQAALRESIAKRISWVGMSQHPSNGTPAVLVTGSRPPVFPMSHQQTLMVRSLRQSKEKPRIPFSNGIKMKRNMVQLKHTHKSIDLNLPLLSPPFQAKSEKKNEILRLEFV